MFRSDEIDLKYYGLVIARWKRLILSVAGACVGLAIVLNLIMQPIYRAVTRLEISKEPTRSPITGELIGDDFQTDNVALMTTAELMTNRGLTPDMPSSGLSAFSRSTSLSEKPSTSSPA